VKVLFVFGFRDYFYEYGISIVAGIVHGLTWRKKE
jgi:hypothetical protein